MPGVFNYNGRMVDNGVPVVSADSSGLRYGDGLFETMLVQNKKIRLGDFHFERLFDGLKRLGFSLPPGFTAEFLESEVLRVLDHNPGPETFRVRLSVFRRGMEESDPEVPDYIIQCRELGGEYLHLNKEGLKIGICSKEFRKNNDSLANLKSNNFLPYIQALRYGKSRGWDDCLLLNPLDRIADATIANIFILKNNTLFTPSLEEGPIAGTMRRYILGKLPALGFSVEEKGVNREDLLEADELFLTNALMGIRWIGSFEEKVFSNDVVTSIYTKIFPIHD